MDILHKNEIIYITDLTFICSLLLCDAICFFTKKFANFVINLIDLLKLLLVKVIQIIHICRKNGPI